jgi:hypothetical protein
MVRADVDCIESCPGSRKFFPQSRMDSINHPSWKVAPRYPRLVCHHNGPPPGSIDGPDGRRCRRQQAQTGHVVDVADFLVERAVPVKKDGAVGNVRHCLGC